MKYAAHINIMPHKALLDPQGKIIARQVKGNILDDILKKEIK
jgi:phosphoribosylformylglycinamidine (FGAM) synthase PurS component